MITEIGIVAGDIWHQLEEAERLSVEELVRRVGKDPDLLLMGLGWLAREGHITIDGDLVSGTIRLNRR